MTAATATAVPRTRPDRSEPATDYADLLPRLNRLAALAQDHPHRAPLRDAIILDLLPVVRNIAGRHSGSNPAIRDDLTQVGTVGLIAAVDRWDPERSPGGVLGYVVPCVRGEILRYFRDRTWAVRVPRRLKDIAVAIDGAVGPLTHALGRPPRPSEIAERIGAPTDEVIEALGAQDSRYSSSLDAMITEDSTRIDRFGELDRHLDHVEFRHALRPLLDRLPERERTILLLRFFGNKTQTQIAEQIGVSQMHVSRLLSRTLQGLRDALLDDTPPVDVR